MKNKFLFTIILTSACLLIFVLKTFAQDGYRTESFKVSKGGRLTVGLSAGDIQIKTWDKNEVKLVYEDNDNEYYDGVKIYQDGNNITVKSNDYSDFEITCPSEFNLSLNTSGGDISIANKIKGEVEINTSGGDITIKDVDGRLSASTAGGDVKCGNINGEVKLSSGGGEIVVGAVEGACKVSTGAGDVNVKNVTKTLAVSTGGGNVSSTGVGGDTKITTGGGDISVNDVSGDLKVTTGGGNIYAVNVNKGGKVVTGGGDITLKNLSDNIEIITGAGNVVAEFVSVGNKESKIITGYGDIIIYIPENVRATIYAKVKSKAWGVDKKEISKVIKSDYKTSSEDFNQKRGEFTATYNINGGGTNIHLETSFGNIEIKRFKR